MPFYEYECSACKFYVEALQKISDPPLSKCPSCGKQTLQRLISAPVFRLKGGGWYETDFKSDKENKRNLAEDKEPAEKKEGEDKSETAKVRVSKALKKAAAKKAAKKVAAKSRRPAAKKPAKPAAGKFAGKSAAKAPRRAAKKSPRKGARKIARKVAKKK